MEEIRKNPLYFGVYEIVLLAGVVISIFLTLLLPVFILEKQGFLEALTALAVCALVYVFYQESLTGNLPILEKRPDGKRYPTNGKLFVCFVVTGIIGVTSLAAVGLWSLPDADFFSVETTFITAGMVSKIHLLGKTVSAWTVDREADVSTLRSKRVDDLITGDPQMVQDALDNSDIVYQAQ